MTKSLKECYFLIIYYSTLRNSLPIKAKRYFPKVVFWSVTCQIWCLFSILFIYINKNETRCRATTMPLLTTLWVNQLALFQHHVTADIAPLSLAGAVNDPGTASRQAAPALSMPFSTSSFNLNPNGSGPPHIPDQSAYYVLKCLQSTSSSHRLTN